MKLENIKKGYTYKYTDPTSTNVAWVKESSTNGIFHVKIDKGGINPATNKVDSEEHFVGIKEASGLLKKFGCEKLIWSAEG